MRTFFHRLLHQRIFPRNPTDARACLRYMCQGSRKETGYKICPVQLGAPPVFYGRISIRISIKYPSVAAAKQMEMVAFKLEAVHTEWYLVVSGGFVFIARGILTCNRDGN